MRKQTIRDSNQVQCKPEDGYKLEVSDLESRGIVLPSSENKCADLLYTTCTFAPFVKIQKQFHSRHGYNCLKRMFIQHIFFSNFNGADNAQTLLVCSMFTLFWHFHG